MRGSSPHAGAFRRKILVPVALLLGACTRLEYRPPVILDVPGRINAHVTLASDGDRVAAAWAAAGDRGTDVYVAVSADGGRTFGNPVRVNDLEGDVTANGEQPPRVLMQGRAVDVLWVSKRGGASAIRAASSTDGGVTFGAARTITPAGLAGARGWESAALGDDGAVHAVWLDGRNSEHAEHAAHLEHLSHLEHPMRQDIYHAVWHGAAAPLETLVAANVCFCCKTAVVSRGRDVYVAWRHLFPGGVRDIAVAHSSDVGATFSAPVRVSADGWTLDACPDNGPALALDASDRLRVVWPTLVQDPGGPRIAIFEASSRDGGATFTQRTRVDGANAAASHPRVASATSGRCAIVWDALAQGERRVLIRTGESPAQVLSAAPASSYPSVAPSGDGFVVAWTEQRGDRSVIRLVRVADRSAV